MGRLVIAHHKSYHPYRRDNIERVRRDEEEARLKEEKEDGRMMLADAEARIQLLRERAGEKPKKKKRQTVEEEMEDARQAVKDQETSGLPLTGGHINFFEDLEQSSIAAAIQSSQAAKSTAPKEDEKGVRLAPSEKDLKPWYSSKKHEPVVDERRRNRDDYRKTTHDPLTFINDRLSSRSGSSTTGSSSSRRRPGPSSSQPTASSRPRSSATKDDDDPYAPALPQPPKPEVDPVSARISRESSERARAQELLRRKQWEASTVTPSTVHGGYGDMYNRAEVEAARAAKRWGETDRDAGRGWDRRTRDRRW